MCKHIVLVFAVSAGLASIVHAQPGGSQTQSIGGAASDSVGTAPSQSGAPVGRYHLEQAWPSKVSPPPILPDVAKTPTPVAPVPIPYPNAIQGSAPVNRASPGVVTVQPLPAVRNAPPPPQPAWPSKIEGPTMIDKSQAR
jgi:hypothetical protein